MKLLTKWALFSGIAICLAVGCSRAPSSVPMAVEATSPATEIDPATSTTPELNYKVVSTDESGNRVVQVIVAGSMTETRSRTTQNEQGVVVEETYDVQIPVEQTMEVIIPASEDVAESVKRILQGQ